MVHNEMTYVYLWDVVIKNERKKNQKLNKVDLRRC